jgi:hypothetical protein
MQPSDSKAASDAVLADARDLMLSDAMNRSLLAPIISTHAAGRLLDHVQLSDPIRRFDSIKNVIQPTHWAENRAKLRSN